jgi:hypothetical protein
MEQRTITVMSTKTQQRVSFQSTATTLGELKNELRAQGIDYTDMTFFEGLSKVELKSDDSLLPHDIPYKGQVTNDLFFMLTNSEKKIKSGGMSRKDMYIYLKFNHLVDKCKETFNKNYTNCSNEQLYNIITQHQKEYTEKLKDETIFTKQTPSLEHLLITFIKELQEAGYISKTFVYPPKVTISMEDSDLAKLFNFVD